MPAPPSRTAARGRGVTAATTRPRPQTRATPPRRRPASGSGSAGRRPPAPPPRPRKRRRHISPARRLQAILLLSLFVLSLIAGRLLLLQGLQRKVYVEAADKQGLVHVTLNADRGRIVDRDGHVLADTVPAYEIDADPALIKQPAAEAAQLGPVLNLKAGLLTQLLSGPGQYAKLAAAMSPEVAQRVKRLDLPGIYAAPTTRRVYPDGSLASNVLGVVGSSGDGSAGLEFVYNKLLSGHDGHEVYKQGINGAPIPDAYSHTTPAHPGSTLQLTLQRDIQWDAQQAATAEQRRSNARGVTVIVMNPHTGALLAVADAPSYNLNHSVTVDKLVDPAAQNQYEPGSVNKVITMSAALQDHLVTPNSPFVVPPVIYQGGSAFHDAEVHGTEHLTLTGILAQSSNIGTIEVARQLGAQRLYHYLRAYGYGQSTGSGLFGEASGQLPPVSQWSATTLPTVAFGQGIGVTALQIASVYSTIANGGVRVEPHVVEATVAPDGHRTPAPASAHTRVISRNTARELSNMLEAVTTTEGTAPQAHIPGYRVAGKTGTANRANGHGGYSGAGYTGSFVGFAPADKPKLVVEVVVDDPRKGSFYGADVAAPVFKDVMSFALQTLRIPPTGTKPPKVKTKW